MILKAGQIYEDNDKPYRYVITCVEERNVHVVNDCGTTNYFHKNSVLKDTLISEYPTWQQAVASEEFNGIPMKKLN